MRREAAGQERENTVDCPLQSIAIFVTITQHKVGGAAVSDVAFVRTEQ